MLLVHPNQRRAAQRPDAAADEAAQRHEQRAQQHAHRAAVVRQDIGAHRRDGEKYALDVHKLQHDAGDHAPGLPARLVLAGRGLPHQPGQVEYVRCAQRQQPRLYGGQRVVQQRGEAPGEQADGQEAEEHPEYISQAVQKPALRGAGHTDHVVRPRRYAVEHDVREKARPVHLSERALSLSSTRPGLR